jgi:hypothetical protein
LYESYIEKNLESPLFKKNKRRRTKKPRRFFNQSANKIVVKDYKSMEKALLSQKTPRYFIGILLFRNYPTIDKINPGESIVIDMFLMTMKPQNLS